MIKKLLKKSERGQAIILIAFAFVGLIAMIGLMTDGGVLLIEYARLKRGIDAASVAAAQQFRKDFTGDDLVSAAENFLRLNQSDVVDVSITMCDPTNAYGGSPAHDPTLCPVGWDTPDTSDDQPARKLVRVTATRNVDFGFMRVLGINGTTIQATSVGEAASIDLVLIMDTSLSMTYGTTGAANKFDIPGDNPRDCNLVANGGAGACQPLDNIKTVARSFVNNFLFFPYDRVAVVTMTSQSPGGTRDPILYPFEDDVTEADNLLANIKAYEPPICDVDPSTANKWFSPSKGLCLYYPNDDPANTFAGLQRPVYTGGADLNAATSGDGEGNPTTIGSSNIGGALYYANNAFITSGRNDAFWVVIALLSGPANATSTDANFLLTHPDGFCPSSTWSAPKTAPCRDSDLAADGITPLITRHSRGNPDAVPPVPPDTNYDADDYARDAADDLANPETGNGITIFTIGLGTDTGLVNSIYWAGLDSKADTNYKNGLPYSAANLLTYIAEEAGDVYDPVTGVLVREANHGQFYYADDPGLDLGPIFLAIAGNIFTRISQ
ncbi:MAG TPA: hypothetical protein PLZ03_15220 [Anaerolineales bacterium]|nr:hypothetical protein [Anaerolineales bacterium]